MSKGGLFKGEHHNRNGNGENGIPVQTPGGPIEVESQEVIITKPAVLDTKKVEFQGKKMTNCEVLSAINESGGGVKIPCDDAPTAHQKGVPGQLVGAAKGAIVPKVLRQDQHDKIEICKSCTGNKKCYRHNNEVKVRQLLRGVYRADQCTDINDAEQAFKEVNYLINEYGQLPALEKRWWSLRRSILHYQNQKKAKGGMADTDIRESSRYVEVKLSVINTDESRFQNRERLNEKKLAYIQSHWNNNELDPVILWREPGTNKIFLLAGHHRLQAAKNRGEKYIDAKFFDGNEDEAKDYAINKSNANRTLENASDRAKIYRKMRADGDDEDTIYQAAEIEGLNRNRIYDFSFLNPSGKTMAALRNFEDSSTTDSSDNISQLAQWVGNARHLFPELTNSHEDEMYAYLLKNLTDKKVKSKTEFADLVSRRINGPTPFKSSSALNFENRVGRGVLETEKISEANKLRAQKKELEKVVDEIQRTVSDKKFRDKRIEETVCLIMELDKKIGDAERETTRAAVADTQQFDIFGELEAREADAEKKKKEESLSDLKKLADSGDQSAIDAVEALQLMEFESGGKIEFEDGGKIKNRYLGVFNGDEMIGAINIKEQTEKDFAKLIDNIHDSGNSIKAISEKEYFEFNDGDELTLEDLRKGNYEKKLESVGKTRKSKPETRNQPFIKDVATIKEHISVTPENIEAQLITSATPELLTLSRKHGVSLAHMRNQLRRGLSVETEHTTNLAIAKVIALQHLDEMPDYYTELAKIEGGGEKKEDGGKATSEWKKVNAVVGSQDSDGSINWMIMGSGKTIKIPRSTGYNSTKKYKQIGMELFEKKESSSSRNQENDNSQSSITDAINALRILADMGDDGARDAIAALELLIENDLRGEIRKAKDTEQEKTKSLDVIIEFVKALEESGIAAKNTHKNQAFIDTIISIVSLSKIDFNDYIKKNPNKKVEVIYNEYNDWIQSYIPEKRTHPIVAKIINEYGNYVERYTLDEYVSEYVYMKLSGDRMKDTRQEIMKALTGDVVSKADAGIHKLIPVLQKAVNERTY